MVNLQNFFIAAICGGEELCTSTWYIQRPKTRPRSLEEDQRVEEESIWSDSCTVHPTTSHPENTRYKQKNRNNNLSFCYPCTDVLY